MRAVAMHAVASPHDILIEYFTKVEVFFVTVLMTDHDCSHPAMNSGKELVMNVRDDPSST